MVRRQRTVLAVWLALTALGGSLMASVDPFYTGLLERGVRDLEAGRTANAERLLTTACFGFLEETAWLAEGLVQLGRAQIRTGNASGLRRTLDRLVEIETRFGAYSSLQKPDLKAALERGLPGPLQQREVDATGLFARTIASGAQEQPIALSERQQRKALERSLETNPDDREALWALARLEISVGRSKPALRRLDRLLTSHPDDRPALCLRSEIAVVRRLCDPLLVALDCPVLAARDEAAVFALECLESAGRIAEAQALIDSLPPERLESLAAEGVAARIARAAGASTAEPTAESATELAPLEAPTPGSAPAPAEDPPAPDPQTTAESTAAKTQPPEAHPEPTHPEPTQPAETQPTLADRILGIRMEAARATIRSELAASLTRATRLAEEHPDSPDAQFLAAELSFRSADYPSAAEYFSRGGTPASDQHVLLFFMAVAMYETERYEEAERVMRQVLPALESSEPNAYVRSYIEKILGSPPA